MNMDMGISTDEFEFTEPEVRVVEFKKPTVESILSSINSGIGLDIAKNHTGICIWNGSEVELYGFSTLPYDKQSYHSEYKMRLDFKNRLKEVVKGRTFDYCIVEDVFGGENFDTVRKLLALNTVIDELIFEGVCSVGSFVRWNKTEWASYFRQLYRQRGRLKSKIETQGILEYLGFKFLLDNKDLPESKKEEIFFEDKCDAVGMLCGLVICKIQKINIQRASSLKLKDVKMAYFEDLDDTYGARDIRIREEAYIEVDLNKRSLERSILDSVKANPDAVLCAYLPVSNLGFFGTKHNFKYYESGEGYILFYKK